MTERELLEAIGQGEARDWEFKSARGGIPGSLWETYSAMANTDGGAIVLGVGLSGSGHGKYFAEGLEKPSQIKKNFWDTINNRNKVNINLLTDDRVTQQSIGDKVVLIIEVPRAHRRQRPVYVGQNPLTGTYRRNYEGDYHCTPDEVGRMLADQAEEPADSRIIEGFTLDDLDQATLQQYRQRFSARSPDHPWLALQPLGLLRKLGGWRRDRQAGKEGLTAAGLLMFGTEQAIRDPCALPEFHLDYREHLSDDPETRWTDRLTVDGTWTANLFQFYQRVIQRLTADLKIPFRLEANLFRKDDTIVHEAIREALVNAIIHADYTGQGGIVIDKHRSRFEISNPGTLLVSIEQLRRGGVSECRNKSLQTMFLMIGGGEHAGSGIDKIFRAWESQRWHWPTVTETVQPDRVVWRLPMISLLPQESLDKLRAAFGSKLDGLGPLEIQALVTAELEGEVTNSRLRLMSEEHAADLTKMLQGLLSRGLLVQKGQKRWTSYQLRDRAETVRLPQSRRDSTHKPGSPHTEDQDSTHTLPPSLRHLDEETRAQLARIASTVREKTRARRSDVRCAILDLCSIDFLTAAELGQLVRRNPRGLQDRYLRPMVREGLLEHRYPGEPNRPDQAYRRPSQH